MWIEIHDQDGRIDVEDLTADGARDAVFQCQQLIEELEAHEAEEEASEVTP